MNVALVHGNGLILQLLVARALMNSCGTMAQLAGIVLVLQ